MAQDISGFVFGLILAQTVWPIPASRIFYDLTLTEAVKKSEKCSRCAPGRPCMIEAMPKLPYVDNWQLEYAEFLTDDELNAKWTGQKDFCDCTPDLWGGAHWKETPSRGCGELVNRLCIGEHLCKGHEPCVPYGLSFICTCNGFQSQICDKEVYRDYPLNPAPWAFVWKPKVVPFLHAPIFNPHTSYWIRGIVVAIDEPPKIKAQGQPPWPVQPTKENRDIRGWNVCIYYSYDDGRDFCSIGVPRENIWHRDQQEYLSRHYNREECYEFLEEKLYYTDGYLCDLLPSDPAFRTVIPYDHWFRVDLNPDDPNNIMIPGDPLPVGRRFKLRLVITNTLQFSRWQTIPDPSIRHQRVLSWRFSQNLDFPDPLPYATTYQLHFRHCTFVFTYTGCSLERKAQPVYNQYHEVVIQAQRHKHPKVKGCPSMVTVDSRWWVRPGTSYNDDGTYNITHPTYFEEAWPLNKNHGTGTGDDSYVYKITWQNLHQRFGTIYDANMVIVHDFEQKGHPRSYVSVEDGLTYQTRNLCYFRWKYVPEIITPESEYISKNCKDQSGLVLKIKRPDYFREPFRIHWWCVNPPDPNDRCTQIRITESEADKLSEYQDFKYENPLECTHYTWVMRVDHYDRPAEIFNHITTYQINVQMVDRDLPVIKMGGVTISQKTEMVNPQEPNYFYIDTSPHDPDIWKWKLWKVLERLKSGETTTEEVFGDWQQQETSTYICIIPPATLEQDVEYLLTSQSKLGRISQTFTANSPPKGGSCDVYPTSGDAGSVFHVRCEKFGDLQQPLSYTVVESSRIKEIPWLEYFTFESRSTVESDVQLFEDDAAVLVFDDEGMHTRIPLNVKINDPRSPPDINRFLENLPKMVEQEKLAAVEEMARFTRYFDRLKIPFEEEQKMAFIEALSKAVNVDSPPTVIIRGVGVLRNLFMNQLEHNRMLTDRVLKYGGEQLHNFADSLRHPNIRNTLKYYDQKQMTELFLFMTSTILLHQDPVIVNDEIREDEHEAHIRRTTQGSYHALKALERLVEAKRDTQYFQLQPLFYSTYNGVSISVQANNASTFNTVFSKDRIRGHTMILPQETVDKYKDSNIFTVMITSYEKVFWWLPNDSGILSVTAEVNSDIGGVTENWNKMEGPFHIYLKDVPPRMHLFCFRCFLIGGEYLWTVKGITDFKHSKKSKPTNQIRLFSRESGTKFGWSKVLPKCSTPDKLERLLEIYHFKVPEGDGVFYLNFPNFTHGRFRVFIKFNSRPTYKEVHESASVVQSYVTKGYTNFDKKWHSDVYVGILPVESTLVPFKYYFRYKTVQCTTFQNGKFEWNGCHFIDFIETETEEPRIWCSCYHLSWFTSNIIIPPIRLILTEKVYLFSPIADNFYVALLVALLLLLLCILIIWSSKKDRQDTKARYVTILKDNWCNETYPYIVAVFTGERWGSGTTSQVAIRILGQKGHSRVHLLADHTRRVMKMGLDDWFLIKTKNLLGSLTNIQLWHNNAGFAPEWYCRKVVIYDVKTKETYTFVVERWFTFDSRVSLDNARMLEVPLMRPEEESTKWKYYISGWIFSGMRDKHIWASIFTRHPRSLYTRCQRAIIAVGLIITTMLTSMIIFNFQAGPSDLPEVSIHFPIVIGIQSAIVAIVLQLFIVLCFELSKRQKIKEMEARNKEKLKEEQQGVNQKKEVLKDFMESKILRTIAPRPILYDAVTLNSTEEKKSKVSIFFLVFAWVLATSSIIICSFFLIMHGLQFGTKKSLVWIISFMSGIVTDSLLFQPLKIIFTAVLISLIFRKSNVDTYVMKVKYEEVEQDDRNWKDCLKKMLAMRLKSPYHPTRSDRIVEMRAQFCSRRVRYLIYYGIISSLLLFMVFLFVYGFEVQDSYYGLRHLDFYFRNESNNLRSKENMYDLFRHKVIPGLHRVYWYNQMVRLPLEANEKKLVDLTKTYDPRLTSQARGYVQDCTNKLVGVPRLRQLRLKEHRIKILRVFLTLFDKAYGKYFAFREDKESYLPRWIKPDNKTSNLSITWRYSSASESKSTAVQGRSGWIYGGGGYIVTLSWNRGRSWRAVQNLQMDKWADEKTRAIVMDINLFNNNVKRFTELRFIVESLPNGGYMSRYQLETTSFFFRSKPQAQLIIALSCIMTVVVLALGFFVIAQISTDGFFNFFSGLRGYLDILVFISGLSTVGHFFNRALQFSIFLEEIDSAPHDAYTSLYGPFAINEDARMVFGIFALMMALHAMLTIYQAAGFNKFHDLFSNIAGLLIALMLLNVTLTYIVHYSTSINDREPLDNTFLHTTFRDYHITGKGEDANARLIYVIILPLIMILLKFNAASVIHFHLRYTEEILAKTYIKTGKSKRIRDYSLPKGKSLARFPKGVFKSKIVKMRNPFVLLK